MNWKKSLVVGFAVLAIASCAKKQELKPDDAGGASGSATATDADVESGRADSDSNNAMGLQTIHFGYDSAQLDATNKELLQTNEKIMKDNPSMAVQIEGHCDDRGGIQYNLALGERRANSIQQMMVGAGIAKSRITTISMGKEKPVAQGNDEASYAQNRRGNFVITSK